MMISTHDARDAALVSVAAYLLRESDAYAAKNPSLAAELAQQAYEIGGDVRAVRKRIAEDTISRLLNFEKAAKSIGRPNNGSHRHARKSEQREEVKSVKLLDRQRRVTMQLADRRGRWSWRRAARVCMAIALSAASILSMTRPVDDGQRRETLDSPRSQILVPL